MSENVQPQSYPTVERCEFGFTSDYFYREPRVLQGECQSLSGLFETVSFGVKNICDKIGGVWTSIKDFLSRVKNTVSEKSVDTFVKFKEYMRHIVESIIVLIGAGFEELTLAFVNAMESISATLWERFSTGFMGGLKSYLIFCAATIIVFFCFLYPGKSMVVKFAGLALCAVLIYFNSWRSCGLLLIVSYMMKDMMPKTNVNLGVYTFERTAIAEPQSNDIKSDLSILFGSLLPVLGLLYCGCTGMSFENVKSDGIEKLMQRFALLGRAAQSWKFVAEYFTDFFDVAMGFIYKHLLGKTYFSAKSVKEIEDLYNKVLSWTGLDIQLEIGRNAALADEIVLVYQQYLVYRRLFSTDKTVMSHLDTLGRVLIPMYKRVVEKNPRACTMRQEPVCLVIMGSAGIGKSYLMTPLQQDLLKIVGKFDPGERLDGKIYTRCAEQEYWDGYCGQPIVIYDDFGQQIDGPTNPNMEFWELIRAVNIFPWQLHSAALAEKANNPFNADFVCLTTNMTNFRNQVKSIVSVDALERRMHCSFKMGLIPDVRVVGIQSERLDVEKLYQYRQQHGLSVTDMSHVIFHRVYTDGSVAPEDMTYDDVIVAVSQQYKRNADDFARRQQAADENAERPLPRGAYSREARWNAEPQARDVTPYGAWVPFDLWLMQSPQVQMAMLQNAVCVPYDGSRLDFDPVLVSNLEAWYRYCDQRKIYRDIPDSVYYLDRKLLHKLIRGKVAVPNPLSRFAQVFHAEHEVRYRGHTHYERPNVDPNDEPLDPGAPPTWYEELPRGTSASAARVRGMRGSQTSAGASTSTSSERTRDSREPHQQPPDAEGERPPTTLWEDCVRRLRESFEAFKSYLSHYAQYFYWAVVAITACGYLLLLRKIFLNISSSSWKSENLWWVFWIAQLTFEQGPTFIRELKGVDADWLFQFYSRHENKELLRHALVCEESKCGKCDGIWYTLKYMIDDVDYLLLYSSLPKNIDGIVPNSPEWCRTTYESIKYGDQLPVKRAQIENLRYGDQLPVRRPQIESDDALKLVDEVLEGESYDDYADVSASLFRRSRGRAKYEGLLSSSARELIPKVRKNIVRFGYDDGTPTREIGFLFVLGGRVALINRHYLENLKACMLQTRQDGGSIHRVYFQHVSTQGFWTQDCAVFLSNLIPVVRKTCDGSIATEFFSCRLPTAMPLGANMVKHFMRRKDFKYLSDGIRLYFPTFGRMRSGALSAETKEGKFKSTQQVTLVDKDGEQRHYMQSGCTDICTEKGDCGIPYILNSDVFQNKLCGVHFAGLPGGGVFAIFCMEDLIPLVRDEFVEADPKMLITEDAQSVDFPLIDSNFKVLGKIEKPIFHPTKTKLIPSPIFNRVYETQQMPSKLGPALDPDGPMLRALKKNCSLPVQIDESCLEHVKISYTEKLLQQEPMAIERTVLTFDEACMGIPGNENFKALQRSKSAGYPHMLEAKKGKTDWFGEDEWTLNSPRALEIRSKVRQMEYACSRGVVPETYFVDTLKDEKRSIDRVLKGKTRVFAAADMVYAILFRQYFLGFLAFVMRTRVRNESAVGVQNLTEWGTLVSALDHGRMDTFVAGDFSNFDGTLEFNIFNCVIDIINEFYDDGDRNRKIRQCLWEALIHSKHIIHDMVYQFAGGQPSGNPSTAVTNSMYNSLAVRYIYYQTFGECVSFNGKIKMIAYGDDNIISVHPSLKNTFTPAVISRGFAEIGMVYTSEDKSEQGENFRLLTEISFLKRSFVCRNGQWLAPLSLESILEMTNWITRSIPAPMATGDNCVNAITELYFHDRTTFEQYAPLIARVYREEFGRVIPMLSWEKANTYIALQEFNTIIPVISYC